MNGPRIRYAQAPTLEFQAPKCSDCWVECIAEDEGWVCPVCGTLWDWDAYDRPGNLYAEWSGEDVSGLPVTRNEDGFAVGSTYNREQRDRLLASIRERV